MKFLQNKSMKIKDCPNKTLHSDFYLIILFLFYDFDFLHFKKAKS